MNANQGSLNNKSSPLQIMFPYMLVIVSLLGLYYLYQYLFRPKTGKSYNLISSRRSAIVDQSKPTIINADQLPRLFEGGEFTMSTWIYVSDWSYRSGFMKSILRIGGQQFDTFRIYLGGQTPTLHIRFHTHDKGLPHKHHVDDDLSRSSLRPLFTSLDTNLQGNTDKPLCDLPEIDLQRWVHLAVSVNAKTVDVYTDGKLARSCVLPSQYKVDSSTYRASLLDYGGFGGQMSTTTMYNIALNPESIYKIYMEGPDSIISFNDWLSSFFTSNVSINMS